MTPALSRCLHTAPSDEAKVPETHAQSQSRALCCTVRRTRASLYIKEKWAWCELFDASRPMLYYGTILSSNAAIPRSRCRPSGSRITAPICTVASYPACRSSTCGVVALPDRGGQGQIGRQASLAPASKGQNASRGLTTMSAVRSGTLKKANDRRCDLCGCGLGLRVTARGRFQPGRALVRSWPDAHQRIRISLVLKDFQRKIGPRYPFGAVEGAANNATSVSKPRAPLLLFATPYQAHIR
jgi:hypothetical protein